MKKSNNAFDLYFKQNLGVILEQRATQSEKKRQSILLTWFSSGKMSTKNPKVLNLLKKAFPSWNEKVQRQFRTQSLLEIIKDEHLDSVGLNKLSGSSEKMKKLQTWLKERGHFDGISEKLYGDKLKGQLKSFPNKQADGFYGTESKIAIQNLQTHLKIVAAKLKNSEDPSKNPFAYRDITEGPDGLFGPNTSLAISVLFAKTGDPKLKSDSGDIPKFPKNFGKDKTPNPSALKMISKVPSMRLDNFKNGVLVNMDDFFKSIIAAKTEKDAKLVGEIKKKIKKSFFATIKVAKDAFQKDFITRNEAKQIIQRVFNLYRSRSKPELASMYETYKSDVESFFNKIKKRAKSV